MELNKSVKRPIVRYHGGKWKIAKWIIGTFPPHRIYTEAYGGAASLLLRKPRCYSEIYNDLNGEMVNLFRVLRNPAQSRELARLVSLTPYSRQEFEESYILADDPIEQARRTLFRAAAGFASGSQISYGTGFRANVTRPHSTPAHNWAGMPEIVNQVATRFRGVIIEHDNALDVLARYDTPETLHLVDPPYVFETRNGRTAGNVYDHEMDDEEHRWMIHKLKRLNGAVILCGYQSEMYAELLSEWRMITKETTADGAAKRTECLWINNRALEMGKLL